MNKKLPSKSEIRKFQLQLLSWFSNNKREFPWRNKNVSSFEKIITEILLQRTTATTVSEFYYKFFAIYKTWDDLASDKISNIENTLKPIGLWKQRASKLKKLSCSIIERGGDIPKKRKEIDSLDGVGQYVGNAIELLIYNRRKPLLDVNMSRVLERYFGPRKLSDIRYDPYLQELSVKVVNAKNSIEINFAILDLSALVCKSRKPDCGNCPLTLSCKYALECVISK